MKLEVVLVRDINLKWMNFFVHSFEGAVGIILHVFIERPPKPLLNEVKLK